MSSNSRTEEANKKQAQQTDKFKRESFLNKYAEEPLDNEVRKQIKALFDGGMTSATAILDKLLTPSGVMPRGEKFEKVRRKVNIVIKRLKKHKKKATD